MQDYPKALGSDAVVGFTVFDNWVGYSPSRTPPRMASESLGRQPRPPPGGEMELYGCGAQRKPRRRSVADPIDFTANDIVVPAGPESSCTLLSRARSTSSTRRWARR